MTTIAVCSDPPLPDFITPAGSTRVEISGLCADPSLLSDLEDTENGVVVLAHGGAYDLGHLQAALRKRGIDPLGVEIIDAYPGLEGDWLSVAGAGAVARATMFSGSSVEQSKLRWPGLLTRRELLRLSAPRYIGAPLIDSDLCVADSGCRSCIRECPVSALSWSRDCITYDKEACIACGICVTTCPMGATENPSVIPVAIEAQIATMAETSATPIGIEFRCRDANPSAQRDGWYPIEVPCTGMLTVGWLLAPLALGAGCVTAAPCGSSGCQLGNSERLTTHLSAAAAFLSTFGINPLRLGTHPAPIRPPLTGLSVIDPFGPLGEAAVLMTLAHSSDVQPGTTFASPVLRTAIVGIDETTCTACTMCAAVCPTNALVVGSSPNVVELRFDPLLCYGCGQCTLACPEIDRGAITLDWIFDPDELDFGSRSVRTAENTLCDDCGNPIASTAMLDRITSMLGDGHQATSDLINRRCLDCR